MAVNSILSTAIEGAGVFRDGMQTEVLEFLRVASVSFAVVAVVVAGSGGTGGGATGT